MSTDVHAAGGVVWRGADDAVEVLLIERTRYRDLTLPKGKVDPGETLPETAVREIFEETGLKVALGPHLGVSQYRLPSARRKIVHYWVAEATPKAVAASRFTPNREVASVRWLPLAEARDALSYPVDVEILDAFVRLAAAGGHQTFPLVALRHAKAIARSDASGPDSTRPLAARGSAQAAALVGQLRAFGVRRVIASPARRCMDTVRPFAAALDRTIHEEPRISQDEWEDGRADPLAVVEKRLRAAKPAVLCSHGPVLPDILDAIGTAADGGARRDLVLAGSLDTGAFAVVHISNGSSIRRIVSVETHAALA